METFWRCVSHNWDNIFKQINCNRVLLLTSSHGWDYCRSTPRGGAGGAVSLIWLTLGCAAGLTSLSSLCWMKQEYMSGRRDLVKLRISSHKLMIELGRYNQTSKDNRHCPFCGSNVIKDKVHFLFRCPTYSMIRNNFYNKVKTLIPNITLLPVNVLINELMNSSNYFINMQFIKYISACFDLRDKLLPK